MRNIVLLFAFALFGCATDMQRVEREVGAGQPLQYKEGYMSGCDSGYVAAGHPYYRFSKDVIRYGNDTLYKQGWDDGFSVCKGGYEAVGRAVR
jgi:hypothetical protein